MLLAPSNISKHLRQHHSRLAVAICIGIGVALMLPETWPLLIRGLAGWNIAVWLYLILITRLMVKANLTQVRKIAQQEYPSRLAELVVISLAAFASLAAIILELTTLKGLSADQRLLHYLFTGITVFGSWSLIAVLFAVHYAHLFYTTDHDKPSLMFSNNEPNPDYWDFLYLAFTIAVAAQTSDVMIMTRTMRKTVLAQSILSFLFNVIIVGLSINIVASLINE